MYHIIVEALNNVVKHAAASRLTLRLDPDERPPASAASSTTARATIRRRPSGGLGLGNIRERVTRLNGQLAISSEPGGGTRLEAMIPYQVEEDR